MLKITDENGNYTSKTKIFTILQIFIFRNLEKDIKNILLILGGGIGDIIAYSAVLKYLKDKQINEERIDFCKDELKKIIGELSIAYVKNQISKEDYEKILAKVKAEKRSILLP